MVPYELIQLQAGWLWLQATLRFTVSEKGCCHPHRISLILLYMFGKSIIALSFSTCLQLQSTYHSCIQLTAVSGIHFRNILLFPIV